MDEAIGEVPKRQLVPREARLDPAPRSNVDDLLSSFASSGALADDRAVRAVAAGLKSMAGLEPTPPPMATQPVARSQTKSAPAASMREPTPSPPRVRRREPAAEPMPVAPERLPAHRPRGLAVPLALLVLALVMTSILWAYPELLADAEAAEPAPQAAPR